MTHARPFPVPRLPKPLAVIAALLAIFLLFHGFQLEQVLAADATPPREGILLVAFGTSVPEAESAFSATEKAFRAAWPGCPVVWAYTSQIIRKKLAKEGRPVGGIAAGLAQLAKDGVEIVRVQSLHIMAGEEFTALERAVLLDLAKHPGRFKAVFMGRPLLESRQDAELVTKNVLDALAKRRKPGDALALMAHGQSQGRADLVLEGTRTVFQNSDPLSFFATVEGARSFDELLAELRAHKVERVWLQPFMLVAGDHARNDLAGEDADSWASRLRAAGFVVEASLAGLGEMPGMAEIFVNHARESHDDLIKEPRKE